MPAPDSSPSPVVGRHAPAGARTLASMHLGSFGVAVGFGVTAAIMFSPVFLTPFPELLGRTLFLSMVLLGVFLASQRCPERWLPCWLPRWLFTTLAVAFTAPLATFLIYLVSVGGNVRELTQSGPRVIGFFLLAGTALVLGLVITLSAQLREREARVRSQALQFELERSRLEREALDAQLALLQAQIEPHFLFNTLANVQMLVESGSPRAAPLLKSLTDYLRASVPNLHAGEPTLEREITRVRAYLELMRMRMPDRLQFAIEVEPALAELPVPPLALLTLVENAVRHGIDPSIEGGRIEVGARRDAATGARHLWVADTGIGMAETATPGTGLANLRARLLGAFGPRSELRLSEVAPHGLRAEIVIPA